MIDLGGRRMLIVEDELLLSLDIVDAIEHSKGVVLGPMATLEAGLVALRNLKPDACLLNIRLGPNMAYELADELLCRGVPFIFASSETRASIPDRFSKIPLFAKPFKMVEVAAWLLGEGMQPAFPIGLP